MKRVFWLAWLLALGALNAPAAGLIIVHEPDFWPSPPRRPFPPPRPMPPRLAPVEISSTKVNVGVRDQVASVTVDEEFYNPNSRPLEGTFLFPVPKGAHLDKFVMEINGRPAEAELLAAEKARGIYEDIVRRLRDPALLEYAGRDLLKVRIFPLEPNSKKHITLTYTQLLKSDSGLVGFQFPLAAEKSTAKPLRNLSFKINLETKWPLKSVYSPSHRVEITRHGERSATIGFEAADARPDQDFELLYSQQADEIGLSLLAQKTDGEDGYFLLLASPGEVKGRRTVPKDVAFVLDTSGSMAGAKLEQARKALRFCVESLNEADRFEVLRFSTEVEPLFNRLEPATKENRARAEAFIKELKATGGTALDDALKKALELGRGGTTQDRPYVVIFLTDGRPTVGNTDENQIADNAIKLGKDKARIFCFGIGTDVNTHLLDRITEGTRAVSQYVLPEEDLEVKVSNFFAKIKEPVLANPQLKFPAGVRVTKLYPASLPDLFNGEQLVAAGRYAGQAEGEVVLEGTVNGERRVFEFKALFPQESREHAFIPRLWATRRVGYLLDEIRLHGENKELKDEVVELARRYGVVTPYTAYLILEDEQRRGLAGAVRSFPELDADRRALNESRDAYFGFKNQVSGDMAVSGARAYSTLKEAQAPQDALTLSSAEALRVAPASAPPAVVQRARQASGRTGVGGGGYVVSSRPAPRELGAEFARQARFVNGRTFYRNGDSWLDSDAQKIDQARKVRVQFGSDEYFELLKKHPEAGAWLALGPKVTLVLEGVLYEVFE